MAAADLLYLVVALLLGFSLGVLALLVMFRKRGAPAAPQEPRGMPPPTHDPPPVTPAQPSWDEVEFEIVEDDEPPRATRPAPQPARPRPPPARAVQPLPPTESPGEIPTEWARRHVGAAPPDRVKGICSGCGTPLSISRRRPLRVACPVCGRTRLLS